MNALLRVLGLIGLLTAPREAVTQDGEREALIERIVAVSQLVVPNPAWLESPEWQDFVNRMRGAEMATLDDDAFRGEFNRAAERLPFTHFRLQRPLPEVGSGSDALSVSEAGDAAAILTVRTFSVDEAEMDAALEQIEAGSYRHLIIDLRENPGGSFPAVAALGRYLTREAIDTGVYLTRRWFVQRPDYPRPDEIASIADLEELDLDAFRQRLQETGAVRLVLPPHDGPIFDGNVYVLTSRETASAAEPFVDLVRRRGGVIVIGETTAGAMLSGERFPVGEGWLLFAPVADYVTADGRRIDRVGVEPDIEVAPDQALAVALEMIESE